MIKLNPRLQRCADSVLGDVVIDIGTDHGYLPCFLVESGACRMAFACDVADGPLLAAKKHIEECGLAGKVVPVLSDGLKSFPPEAELYNGSACESKSACESADIVIAGMGGELIAKILAEGIDAARRCRLILQPNTRVSTLRRWLLENGFEIISESAVRDGRFIYTVICAAFSGEHRTPDELECITGKLRPDVPLDREYLEAEISRIRSAAEGKKSSEDIKTNAEGERLAALAESVGEYINR